MAEPKVLILGAAGMLGHKLAQVLGRRFPGQVWGSFRKVPAAYSFLPASHRVSDWDLRDWGLSLRHLDQLKPTYILNCTGITIRHIDPLQSDSVVAMNALLPHRLRQWCLHQGARLMTFSTDCVFQGDTGPYTEASVKDAMDLYGLSKSLGEVDGEGICTIRSSFLGPELQHHTELFDWAVSQRGQSIQGFTKAMYSGLSTLKLAEFVGDRLQGQWVDGLIQLASEPISKYELLKLMNEIFQLDMSIEPVARGKSKVLECERARQTLGFTPPRWEDMLRQQASERGL